MWLKEKNERALLVLYYRQWREHGFRSFPLKQPFDQLAHQHLAGLGLIDTDYAGAMRVSLTPEGIRLGKIYSGSWWGRSGLWFAEHKHHWFWVVVVVLIGPLIVALLAKWLGSW